MSPHFFFLHCKEKFGTMETYKEKLDVEMIVKKKIRHEREKLNCFLLNDIATCVLFCPLFSLHMSPYESLSRETNITKMIIFLSKFMMRITFFFQFSALYKLFRVYLIPIRICLKKKIILLIQTINSSI